MRTGAFLFSALSLVVGCSEVEVDPQGGGGQGGSGGSGGQGAGGSDYLPFPQSCTPTELRGACDGESFQKCGNGTLDSCEICWTVDDGPEQCDTITEACDLTPTATCQALGYQSGETICSPACGHDIRDCDSCLGSPSQLACARPRLDGFDVMDIEIATNGDEIAAAWFSFGKVLHFARFTKDLQLIADKPGCGTIDGGGPISLAPAPGGWVVAVGGVGESPQMQIIRLDAEGNEMGAPRLVANATFPSLVGRPGATPYLVYSSTAHAASPGDVVAELLDETGAATWQAVLPNDAFGEITAAGFADPGLLVALREAETASTTLLVAIDETGAVSPARDVGLTNEIVLAAAAPGRVAAVWRRGESQELQWLDGSGEDVGAPVTLAPRDGVVVSQQRAVTVSNGRAVVMLAEDMQKTLTMFHVEQDGSYSVEPYALATEPQGIAWLAGTQLGGDPVFAWTTYSAGDPAGDRFVLGSVKR